MEPIHSQTFAVTDQCVDCYGRLKPSTLLYFAQEAAGQHCLKLEVDHDSLADHRLFWAVTRHRVQVSRLPVSGETITLETWPMPTTRVAFPRSMVAYDADGQELFRSISLWVLMNLDNRSMVLPGKSGIEVNGTLRGSELAVPHSILPMTLENHVDKTVTYSLLDRNGHMNNTRYLDWIDDLLPSAFHQGHTVREFTVCYLSEAREGQEICLNWELSDGPCLHVDAHRASTDVPGKQDRVFSAQVLFD